MKSRTGATLVRYELVRYELARAAAAVLALLTVLAGAALSQVVLSGPARAASGPLPGGLRLVMVETQSCVYCIRWHKEVGPSYPLSDAGRRAPLVRRELGDASLGGLKKVVYTPTFILVLDGEEIDRLVGYPGAEYFYSELADMLAKVEQRPGQPVETRVRW